MRRGARIALLSLSVLPILVWAALRLGFFAPVINFALSRGLRGRTPLQVRVDSVRSDFFHTLEFSQVVVLAPVQGTKLPLLFLDHLSIDYDLTAVFRRQGWRQSIESVRLQGLKIFVWRGAGGGWNVTPLQSRGPKIAEGDNAAYFTMFPACRVELDDATVVLNDELRGFQSSVDRIHGNLDTRSFPKVAFALAGQTEGHAQRNLALAGTWNQKDKALAARLNLDDVALARYLNYFLPIQGLHFTAGTASLSIQLRKEAGRSLEASGRAELLGGALSLPGVRQPVSQIRGAMAFASGALRFKKSRAHFLGSDWAASGAILDLGRPRFDLTVTNPGGPLDVLSQEARGLGLLSLSGTASVTASLLGPVAAPRVAATLRVPLLGIAGFEMSNVSVNAALLGRRLTVRQLRGDLWGGQLDGNAAMDLTAEGALAADVTVTGALVQAARYKGQAFYSMAGLGQAHMMASGRLRSPDLSLNF